jgi:hypothetical protein
MLKINLSLSAFFKILKGLKMRKFECNACGVRICAAERNDGVLYFGRSGGAWEIETGKDNE